MSGISSYLKRIAAPPPGSVDLKITNKAIRTHVGTPLRRRREEERRNRRGVLDGVLDEVRDKVDRLDVGRTRCAVSLTPPSD